MELLPIAAPPWGQLGKRLESLFRKACLEHGLIRDDRPIACALSGGKDSLTLLYLLHAVRGRGFPRFPIHAIHVWGGFSCGASVAKNWIGKICDRLEIPLSLASQEGEPTECYSCSRRRRRLIFDAAERAGIETIAFGHHRDDNAQTLLLNLFQKGEMAGILPLIRMHRFGKTLIRPMIYIAESQIREFARLHGFFRITCQCPIGAYSMRKEVDRLMEQMQGHFPHIRNNLALASLNYGSKKANAPLEQEA